MCTKYIYEGQKEKKKKENSYSFTNEHIRSKRRKSIQRVPEDNYWNITFYISAQVETHDRNVTKSTPWNGNNDIQYSKTSSRPARTNLMFLFVAFY